MRSRVTLAHNRAYVSLDDGRLFSLGADRRETAFDPGSLGHRKWPLPTSSETTLRALAATVPTRHT